MEMESSGDIQALMIVINAGFSTEVMDVARAAGAKGATIMNARGEGLMHKSFLGITLDSEKEMILMLMDTETADKVMAAVKAEMGVNSLAHGICFTMPVGKTTVINNFPLPPAE